MGFMFMFTIAILNIKLANDSISRDNFESAEIWEITNFRGLKADQWLKSLRSVAKVIILFTAVSYEFS
jgi:hypothetical protein